MTVQPHDVFLTIAVTPVGGETPDQLADRVTQALAGAKVSATLWLDDEVGRPADPRLRPAAYPSGDRDIAWNRSPSDPCQASTPGCCINHSKDTEGCEGW